MKIFESRFNAQVAKFNSISDTTKLPECITALMLLSNSAINDVQRVSVMAAAAPSASNLNAQSSNDQFLAAVTYTFVSSVIKQCDKAAHSNTGQASGTLAAGSGNVNRSSQKYGDRNRPRISPTMKYLCDTCGKYGHWKRNHMADGSLPPGVKSLNTPQVQTEHSSRQSNSENQNYGDSSSNENKKKTLSFNTVTLDECPETPISIGPLVDSGAPYSAIGLVELNILADHLGLQPNPKLGPLPKMLQGYNSCQYGTGNHASPSRKILGSILLTATSDTGNPVRIVYGVLDGSS